MNLSINDFGSVVGSYKNDTPNVNEVGIVEGKLSDNGNKIEGNWKNKYNEFGKFIFKISLDGKTFEGNYSMQNEKVTISSNSWNGKRVY